MDVDALLEWYERVRRPLPWRETRDPYALLVSEVMLQQTQALRVVPYYERWLDRVPDGRRSGGRAGAGRAGAVVGAGRTTGGRWRCSARPRTSSSTAGRPTSRSLPGVGPYTAAAVGSFAWDRQAAAVDTNVKRVLTRREGLDVDVTARADALVPAGRAAPFNQAMMELGATVCRPRTPTARSARSSAAACRLVVAPARRVEAGQIRGHATGGHAGA